MCDKVVLFFFFIIKYTWYLGIDFKNDILIVMILDFESTNYSLFMFQLQQQMLKALNPALNFDMTNEQIIDMMNQSGFGMVAMATGDQQQQQQQMTALTQVRMRKHDIVSY